MAEENYNNIIQRVLQHEGGYVNNGADRGGPTMKGVTWNTYNSYLKSIGLPPLKSATDVRNIPDQHLSDIYYNKFWLPIGGPTLPTGLDYTFFDMAVNSGPGNAVNNLRDALGMPQVPQIDRKGEWGSAVGPNHPIFRNALAETINEAWNQPLPNLVNRFNDAREAFYERRVASDPSQRQFASGWANRLEDVRQGSTIGATQGAIPNLRGEIDHLVVPTDRERGIGILNRFFGLGNGDQSIPLPPNVRPIEEWLSPYGPGVPKGFHWPDETNDYQSPDAYLTSNLPVPPRELFSRQVASLNDPQTVRGTPNLAQWDKLSYGQISELLSKDPAQQNQIFDRLNQTGDRWSVVNDAFANAGMGIPKGYVPSSGYLPEFDQMNYEQMAAQLAPNSPARQMQILEALHATKGDKTTVARAFGLPAGFQPTSGFTPPDYLLPQNFFGQGPRDFPAGVPDSPAGGGIGPGDFGPQRYDALDLPQTVQQFYKDFTGTTPNQFQQDYWTDRLASYGGDKWSALQDFVANANEVKATPDDGREMYQRIFGQGAELPGLPAAPSGLAPGGFPGAPDLPGPLSGLTPGGFPNRPDVPDSLEKYDFLTPEDRVEQAFRDFGNIEASPEQVSWWLPDAETLDPWSFVKKIGSQAEEFKGNRQGGAAQFQTMFGPHEPMPNIYVDPGAPAAPSGLTPGGFPGAPSVPGPVSGLNPGGFPNRPDVPDILEKYDWMTPEQRVEMAFRDFAAIDPSPEQIAWWEPEAQNLDPWSFVKKFASTADEVKGNQAGARQTFASMFGPNEPWQGAMVTGGNMPLAPGLNDGFMTGGQFGQPISTPMSGLMFDPTFGGSRPEILGKYDNPNWTPEDRVRQAYRDFAGINPNEGQIDWWEQHASTMDPWSFLKTFSTSANEVKGNIPDAQQTFQTMFPIASAGEGPAAAFGFMPNNPGYRDGFETGGSFAADWTKTAPMNAMMFDPTFGGTRPEVLGKYDNPNWTAEDKVEQAYRDFAGIDPNEGQVSWWAPKLNGADTWSFLKDFAQNASEVRGNPQGADNMFSRMFQGEHLPWVTPTSFSGAYVSQGVPNGSLHPALTHEPDPGGMTDQWLPNAPVGGGQPSIPLSAPFFDTTHSAPYANNPTSWDADGNYVGPATGGLDALIPTVATTNRQISNALAQMANNQNTVNQLNTFNIPAPVYQPSGPSYAGNTFTGYGQPTFIW